MQQSDLRSVPSAKPYFPDQAARGRAFCFDRFTFLPHQALLLRDGEAVRVGSRALDILECLLEQAGAIVEKQELSRRVWPTTVVEEVSLRVHLMALRKALHDGEAGARYIVNAPGRGYRFVAPVHVTETPRPRAPAPYPSMSYAPHPVGADEAEETTMPILNVQILRGRTPAQKKVFLKELGELVMQRLEVPEEAVRIVLTEIEPDDWMVGTRSIADLRAGAG